VGRHEDELALATMLEENHLRLVTLVGPGGVGKTRLAARVAGAVSRAFSDGVVFVRLAAITDASSFIGTVGHALGLSELFELPTIDSLSHALAGRHLLLVLDNFEHLLGAARNVGELLARCPALRVLVTSRTRLAVSGEHLFRVRPLSVPRSTPTPEVASTWAGVALFIQRAQAVRPGFELSADNVEAVVGICRRLDGLPLALELAASRLTILPPSVLLERLQSPISILTSGSRDAPERHQTLQTTIAWSYALLAERHQVLLRRLGIFAGEASFEAVSSLCPDLTELDVLDGISALADSSFIELTSFRNEPRFSMLETIRDFALQRLRETKEEPELRTRHLEYLVHLARAAEPHLIGPGQVEWTARLHRELPNVRFALEWAINNAPSEGLRLATALRFFWYVGGYQRQACDWLSSLIAQTASADAPLDRARAALALGYLRTMLAEYETAAADLERALDIGRNLSDACVIAFALRFLGVIANARGEYARARQHLAASQATYEQLGLESDAIVLRMFLGDTAVHEGDLAGARQLYEDCSRRLENSGNSGTLAYPVRRLALLAAMDGGYAQAASLYAESLAFSRGIGQQQGIAACAVGLADLAARQHIDLRAAYLLGAVDAYLKRVGAQLAYSVDREQFRQTLETVRTRLSPEDFRQAWSEGQSRQLDDPVGDDRTPEHHTSGTSELINQHS
jgi:predicted ATPase